MITPYDWQEGIGNRAQYIESRLALGSPVLAVSLNEGILIFTFRRRSRKIFEVYDRLVFAGLGQQNDIEALRIAAVDFASQEGYGRSEQDVTIQRVATALSAPLKRAFADFGSAPLVARCLFAEVNAAIEEDRYYTLDYDGDFQVSKRCAVIAGLEEQGGELLEKLSDVKASLSAAKAIPQLEKMWEQAAHQEGAEPDPSLTAEAVLLERSDAHENRFRILIDEEF